MPEISKPFTDFQQAIDFLYTQLPAFQRIGAAAYKKDLSNTIELCNYLGHPQHQFKSVHIAGTNGKGSSSHMLAAVLQKAGYKTGLYTSPHLKSFTERIKIDGIEVSEEDVTDFVNRIYPKINEIQPSFFEITVVMAFDYFAREQVDIAVVEVGMGGRLDSTNLVIPEVSMITNISLDHQQWLGNSLEEIALEKAGIVKEHIPIVISERQAKIDQVFSDVANTRNAPITFATDEYMIENNETVIRNGEEYITIKPELKGAYQGRNICGVLSVVGLLNKRGFIISQEHVQEGIASTAQITGLKGRWQLLATEPTVICDVGHNEAGINLILSQIEETAFDQLHIVWGMVNDKEVSTILKLLPKKAFYYFTQAKVQRAMNAYELYKHAKKVSLEGMVITDVNDALTQAQKKANKNDLIFIGGSTFVVAELDLL